MNSRHIALFACVTTFSSCGVSCGPYKPVPDAGSTAKDAAAADVAADTAGGCVPNSQPCSIATVCCSVSSTCNSTSGRCQACLLIDDFCSDNVDCCSGTCNGGACQ